MTEQYWSQREGNRRALTVEFWTAFEALIRQLIERQSCFGEHVISIRGRRGFRDKLLREELCLRLGRDGWSPYTAATRRPALEAHVLDYVEVMCALCNGRCQATYTASVNALFRRFNHPFELRNGIVCRTGSTTLDSMVAEMDFPSGDAELLRWLDGARQDFFNAREDRRGEALWKIVQATERLKTEALGGDKKNSSEALASELAATSPLKEEFSTLLKTMGAISHEGVRHSEHGKQSIVGDPVLVEFLYFHYFNLVRALARRRWVEAKSDAQ